MLYRKTSSSGVARNFVWGDQKHGYLALLMNKGVRKGGLGLKPPPLEFDMLQKFDYLRKGY